MKTIIIKQYYKTHYNVGTGGGGRIEMVQAVMRKEAKMAQMVLVIQRVIFIRDY